MNIAESGSAERRSIRELNVKPRLTKFTRDLIYEEIFLI